MDNQQVFDKVAVHLLKQGRQSRVSSVTGDYDGCAYRGAEGTSCAVGCLIPDESYIPDMEGAIVCQLYAQHLALLPDEVFNHTEGRLLLLGRLQDAHDDYAPFQWPRQLETVAEEFGLNTNAIKYWL